MSVPRTLMWTYPWDLADAGLDAPLEAIRGRAGVEAVSLAVAYHISTYFLPGNPQRHVYFGEDGRVFFPPQLERYGGGVLRPDVSAVVDGPHYLRRTVDAIRRHGLGFTAWVVYNFNHHLARSYPQCAKVDALGNRYLNQLCPANPDVAAYHLALTDDIVDGYRPDYLFVESPGYLPWDYGWSNPKVLCDVSPRDAALLGLCFCPHCVAAAGRAGIDGGRLRAAVAATLRESLPLLVPEPAPPADEEWQRTAFGGDLGRFLTLRADIAADRFEGIAGRCSAARVGVFGGVQWGGGEDGAAGRVAALLDRGLAPLPGAGALPHAVADRKAALGPRSGELIVHTHPPGLKDKETYVSRVVACRDAGADGFGCYNFGLVRPAHLDWVRAAADAWRS